MSRSPELYQWRVQIAKHFPHTQSAGRHGISPLEFGNDYGALL